MVSSLTSSLSGQPKTQRPHAKLFTSDLPKDGDNPEEGGKKKTPTGITRWCGGVRRPAAHHPDLEPCLLEVVPCHHSSRRCNGNGSRQPSPLKVMTLLGFAPLMGKQRLPGLHLGGALMPVRFDPHLDLRLMAALTQASSILSVPLVRHVMDPEGVANSL
jgi:hypothetical protein